MTLEEMLHPQQRNPRAKFILLEALGGTCGWRLATWIPPRKPTTDQSRWRDTIPPRRDRLPFYVPASTYLS